ncbi:hypothetical protein DQW50_11145 [Halorubrum sp. 48-1-W]|uniref:hypothetical protein n=1 Tax=Halorubrum sp. 48-1-W TaxID=2249761 RepID=UPI000DCDB5DE|nr:hypothetical protein [Halorubrum sp. 48-1-W]RAW45024.1 hypothetical protein DQW50_11145 [Halorubrum sp. 48-1-W]
MNDDAAASTGPPREDGGSDVADPAETDAPRDAADVDFADLSLPQRLFVAAVQNPTRGIVIAVLFAFGFSFYVALWMAFPRVSALFSAVGVVVVLVLLGLYYLLARLLD